MKLVARPLDLEVGGKYIVIMNKEDTESIGLHALDRVRIKYREKELTAIVDETVKFTIRGEIVTNDDVTNFFELVGGEHLEVFPEKELESMIYIKQKISGARLDFEKTRQIIRDVVDKKLSTIELAAFVTALYTHGISIDEAAYLSKAMVETGKTLKFPGKVVCDKHSIGGIPGDKTSLIMVPIIASAGFIIPKSSSKAITSPCGTAERMAVLAPVNLSLTEIEHVVKKTNGCLVWGGALDIAPADDIFIQIEYPLGIDPLLLPSIMSKKKAIGAHYVVIDIPTGKEAKVKTNEDARLLADDFIELGRKLGIHVACGITFGEQPIGHCIGPALEAREALLTLQGKGARDLTEKATMLCDIMFNEAGARDHGAALEIIRTGRAEKKMREIIEEQGGDPKIKPEEIPIGSNFASIKSNVDGKVLWIKNSAIVSIARLAGAPKDKGAGIYLNAKMGNPVKKNSILFTIYSNTYSRLNEAVKAAEELKPIVVGKQFEEKMLLDRVFSEIPTKTTFMLER